MAATCHLIEILPPMDKIGTATITAKRFTYTFTFTYTYTYTGRWGSIYSFYNILLSVIRGNIMNSGR